jgi:hypothetical protein
VERDGLADLAAAAPPRASGRAEATSILVNHVYYSPVGHVVEAIRYARGFKEANPGSEVHVALSDGAPWELCAGAPWAVPASGMIACRG